MGRNQYLHFIYATKNVINFMAVQKQKLNLSDRQK